MYQKSHKSQLLCLYVRHFTVIKIYVWTTAGTKFWKIQIWPPQEEKPPGLKQTEKWVLSVKSLPLPLAQLRPLAAGPVQTPSTMPAGAWQLLQRQRSKYIMTTQLFSLQRATPAKTQPLLLLKFAVDFGQPFRILSNYDGMCVRLKAYREKLLHFWRIQISFSCWN